MNGIHFTNFLFFFFLNFSGFTLIKLCQLFFSFIYRYAFKNCWKNRCFDQPKTICVTFVTGKWIYSYRSEQYFGTIKCLHKEKNTFFLIFENIIENLKSNSKCNSSVHSIIKSKILR